MLEVPSGSIYFWMYKQGLKHVPWSHVRCSVLQAGKEIRDKDEVNFWNGWYRSDLYLGEGKEDVFMLTRSQRPKAASSGYMDTPFEGYPVHPYLGKPEVENRWVPCNMDNKPMMKWGNGCMSLADAKACRDQVYLAENLKGCQHIVIDCDGDHEMPIDMETVGFLFKYTSMTHAMFKPKVIDEYEGYEATGCKLPASFHLSFKVDRLIPTMHFPWAHIDIVGNRRNSLRYFKDKNWNGLPMAEMTPEIWEEIKAYVKHRKEGEGNG